MNMNRSRANYWSCTDFANWVRRTFDGIEKPHTATGEEWDQYRIDAQTKNKFVYWLTGDGFNKLQDVVYFPYDIVDTIRVYIINRYLSKTHYVPTGLEPGSYYDADTRLLHGMFELLVDFIEVEKAWMHIVFETNKTKWEKYGYRWWHRYHILRWTRKFRSPEAGLAHLNWEIALSDDGGAEGSLCLSQAQAAKEQLALYTWWKHKRPMRIDPYDVKDLTYQQCHEMEEKYYQEDEEMLIRLARVRRSLWA